MSSWQKKKSTIDKEYKNGLYIKSKKREMCRGKEGTIVCLKEEGLNN